MTLTLEKFEGIHFDSTFDVEASEFKTPNIHRAMFKVRGNGDTFSREEFQRFREEIRLNIKMSGFRGFGFGLILNGFVVPDGMAMQWIDNTDRRGGACQWVIITDKAMKRGTSVHMWQRGRTTDIYESILSELMAEGVSLVNNVKEPTGLMKWAVKLSPFLGLQLYRPPM